MEIMSDAFRYLPEWQALLCTSCGHCLRPGRSAWTRHLRLPPHCLKGALLKEQLELFDSYRLCTADRLAGQEPEKVVAGLRVLDGFQCLTCSTHLTRDIKAMGRHVSKAHQQMPSLHKKKPLWRACKLQTFIAENRFVRYFVVSDGKMPTISGEDGDADEGWAQSEEELAFFERLDDDATAADRNAIEEADIVHGFDSHRSAVVPWLRRTGIEMHTRGLLKNEMFASFAVPTNADTEPELFLMIDVLSDLLSEAHGRCFDGPDCILTWPRQLALSRFHTTSVPGQKMRAFEPKKEPSALMTYFSYWKQLLTYCYRVAHGAGHFRRDGGTAQQQVPEDCIRLTGDQAKAWKAVSMSAMEQDRSALRDALLSFSMMLICHEFGGNRYSSVLLSFCAMLSIKPSTKTWKEPGNYNSCLSGIIWVAQLLVLYTSAMEEKAELGKSLECIEKYCGTYLRPDTETPIGEILGWRILLFSVSREVVSPRQAQWDVDEKVLTYGDVDLHLDQVSQLLLAEFTQAEHLLYDELMFGCQRTPRMRAWALKDNLDGDAVGYFFGKHRENADILNPLAKCLRTVIQDSKPLREMFLDTAADGTKIWRERAIRRYEATADAFLQRLAVLVHLSSGQPLRESELFSITWRNTQRQRNVYLKHGQVMLHTTYHKGQQQTGRFKNNIRFLPSAVGDLLVNYIVYVISLRQVFLRQSTPDATLSPYLWWKDGRVWTEGRLTRCMEQACARNEIPRLHIANWRQMTVSIVKTKFKADIGCFELDGADDDVDSEELEADIRIMTQQRNHSTRTANRAYANQQSSSFGSVWDGLIRRNLRASSLWQDLWGLDALFGAGRKRKQDNLELGSTQMLKRIAVGVYQPQKRWSAAALLKSARKLYRDEMLQWRSAAQERAMMTVMSLTEQVIAVLPTGGGKSLLFMLPCILPDAKVTIVILPLVSLRGDLLRRVRELGLDHMVWRPGEACDARLVFATVEAASTPTFLAYAHGLAATRSLGRIVIDEAHLTVTTSDYRQAMVDLALIRSVRTQFVYLTATLPPMIQARFEHQNNLANPKMIRASTNRANLLYAVRRADELANLLEEGAQMARHIWQASGLFDQSRDKIILYARTRAGAINLAGLLSCPLYTAEVGTAAEKETLLRTWLAESKEPYLVATSALGAGFDYAHVRLVMHIGEPNSLVDFAQESGRAGRDRKEAYSVVLLPAKWQPQVMGSEKNIEVMERRVLSRYLEGRDCRRACLSEYLDTEIYWKRCEDSEDIACDVCSTCAPSMELPTSPEVSNRHGPAAMAHTGSAIIQRKHHVMHLELSRYREDLLAIEGTCILCRMLEEPWDHEFTTCFHRFNVFRARDRAKQQCHGAWIAEFHACYWCYNPQFVCQRADPKSRHQSCKYADIVIPLCFGVFHREDSEQWFVKHFHQKFKDETEFLVWCGQATSFGGGKAIWAVRVAAAALLQLHLY